MSTPRKCAGLVCGSPRYCGANDVCRVVQEVGRAAGVDVKPPGGTSALDDALEELAKRGVPVPDGEPAIPAMAIESKARKVWQCRLCRHVETEATITRRRDYGRHVNAHGVRVANDGIAYCPVCVDETLVEGVAGLDMASGPDRSVDPVEAGLLAASAIELPEIEQGLGATAVADPRVFGFGSLESSGLLWLLNRCVLNPRGFAIRLATFQAGCTYARRDEGDPGWTCKRRQLPEYRWCEVCSSPTPIEPKVIGWVLEGQGAELLAVDPAVDDECFRKAEHFLNTRRAGKPLQGRAASPAQESTAGRNVEPRPGNEAAGHDVAQAIAEGLEQP